MSGHYDAERYEHDALALYLARGRSLQARAIGDAVGGTVRMLSALFTGAGRTQINRSSGCPC